MFSGDHPMLFISDWYILPLAFLLDFLLGDPVWLPHPVRWMGKAIEKLEPVMREKIKNTQLAGTCFAIILIVATYAAASIIIYVTSFIHPVMGAVVEIAMVYTCISAFSLRKAALDVHRALNRDGIDSARKKLALIVGRDVDRLDRQGVLRALIETVSENLVDGVISPLFWAGIGGAPLAMAYKMVNTLDSMVGYKNETYMDFGMTAARIDDLANYIPARMSVPIVACAAFFMKAPWKRGLEIGFRDGMNHSSPNSGYPEAAFSGVFGVRLGGPSYYKGLLVGKPFIGETFGPVGDDVSVKACRLMIVSSALSVFMAMTLAHIVSFIS